MGNIARVKPPSISTGNVIRDSSLGLVPETVDLLAALNDKSWRQKLVRPALIEILRLRNARHVNCVICKSVRYDVARRDGLTEDKVSAIGKDGTVLSEEESLAVEFAETYLLHPDELRPGFAEALRATFTVEQICHMAVALGAFNTMSRAAVSLGGMPESMPVTEVTL